MKSLGTHALPLAVAAALSLPGAALAVPPGGYGDLIEQVGSAVVYIEVTSAEPADAELPDNLPPALREQFRRNLPDGAPRQGLGSGFLISEDGQIVTNHHVVAGAELVDVKLPDGRSFKAEVVGSDPATDLAVLKIKADADLPYVSFGSSDEMRVGDEVVAVGNPFGLSSTVTSGIVSAKARNINAGPYDEFIQTDAAINRGNSGGPLFNNEGDVIGVNTAILSPGGGSVGIGFAVPSDLAQEVVADLSDDGNVTRGWLGVQIRPMSDEIAEVLGYDDPRGAVIAAVTNDGPAEDAGLQSGDIILTYEGSDILSLRDLTHAAALTDPGAVATISLLRKGQEKTVDVTIGTMPDQAT